MCTDALIRSKYPTKTLKLGVFFYASKGERNGNKRGDHQSVGATVPTSGRRKEGGHINKET